MPTAEEANASSVSTSWEWKRVKIRRPAGGQTHSRPKGGRWRSLPPRRRQDTTIISLKYREGGECWYEVTSRGKTGMMPGWRDLHSVVEEIVLGRDFPYPER